MRASTSVLIAAIVGLLVLGMLVLGPGRRSGRDRGIEGANIVLIVIDTLRADHLPFYGYARDTAPFLSSLARDGIVFDRAYSASSWTTPAMASIFTSLHPLQHGMLRGFQARQRFTLARISTAADTLPEALRRAGYRTYGFSDNRNAGSALGFDRGFDRFHGFDYAGADHLNQRVRESADEIRSGGKYFLYLHYMDPHVPYQRREPWYGTHGDPANPTVSAYDSEIHHVDGRIREMFELFGWDHDTLVLVTSDHGEEFGEHGGKRHGRTLFREVIDVPLIAYFPDAWEGGRRLSARVSTMDIFPTLADLVGLPPDPALRGRSLAGVLRGEEQEAEHRPVYFYLHRRRSPWDEQPRGLEIRGIIRDGWKYLDYADRDDLLFDTRNDPGERSNLLAARRDDAAALAARMDAFLAHAPRLPPERRRHRLDAAEVARLRALGYADDAPVDAEDTAVPP